MPKLGPSWSGNTDLQVVLDAFVDGVVVIDDEGQIAYLNESASRLLELSASSAVGSKIDRFFEVDDALVNLVEGVCTSGRGRMEGGREVRLRRGESLLLDISVSPILAADGSRVGVLVVLCDRRVQRSAEQEASVREQLQAFGRFAAGIAHEVKNPLAGIQGMAELLAARVYENRSRESAELIVREVRRIATLVDDLLVFSGSGSLQYADVNIHQVLDDVVALVSAESSERVRFDRQYDPSIPYFRADPGRLVQVFLNITRNALQAVGSHGYICVSTRMAMPPNLMVRKGRPVPTVLATVKDSGPGIAPELLEKVTTPLFTTRSQGTGLGLSVAQHWISRHNGTLRLESEVGSGTSVHIALPLVRR
ncbi:MAG: PAS domain-containing protein [Myxococcales bacterium]|nr:PAS domain-containing protein [Myxococcales bacterium]